MCKHGLLGRDGCRVPIPFDSHAAPTFGFSPPGAREPHLPIPPWFGSYAANTQDGKEGSALEMYRAAIRMRRELREAGFAWATEHEDALHFERTGKWQVIMNFGQEVVPLPEGAKVLLTSGPLDGHPAVPQDTTVWFTSS